MDEKKVAKQIEPAIEQMTAQEVEPVAMIICLVSHNKMPRFYQLVKGMVSGMYITLKAGMMFKRTDFTRTRNDVKKANRQLGGYGLMLGEEVPDTGLYPILKKE